MSQETFTSQVPVVALHTTAMKIISWNVNGIRAAHKKGLDGFVQTQKADILCLQETKAHPEQLSPEIRTLGHSWSAWATAQKKGYSGVATFCQQPPASSVVGLGQEEFDSEGRVVITDHEDFLLYNIYFPNGQRDDIRQKYKMKFHEFLLEHLSVQLKKEREVIVLGDYNVAPQEIDIHDPKRFAQTSGFLPSEREWFQKFLKLGFIDTFRHFYPDAKDQYSWWNQIDRSRMSNRGWRIDLICATRGLMGRMKGASIMDEIEGSDHCPIVLELK